MSLNGWKAVYTVLVIVSRVDVIYWILFVYRLLYVWVDVAHGNATWLVAMLG